MRRAFGLDPTRILAPAGEIVDDLVANVTQFQESKGPLEEPGWNPWTWRPEGDSQRTEFEGMSTENKGRKASVNPAKDIV